MSLNADQLTRLSGRVDVLDADGRRLGRLQHVYDSDRSTGEPTWVTVDDDRSDRPVRLVPLRGARLDGAELRLAYPGGLIDSAPDVSVGEVVDSRKEGRLRAHYGLNADAGNPGVVITRSEERMVVGTAVEAIERIVVHKYIVTEEVTHTFTLRREEVRVEHQPLSGAVVPPGTTGPAFTDEVEEIVLYAEEPVFSTRVVPREVVRVSKHTVTEQQTVSADLAREQIDLDQTEPRR